MMHGASGVHRIDLTALNRSDLVPSIQLKTASMVLKPTEAKISPLTSRDTLPHGRQIYQNLLTYVLNLSKAQEVAFSLPLLNNVLYESEFESQFIMCFDANRRQVGCGDAYSGSTFYKLGKGEYTVKVQVRHEKKDLLEKVNEATLTATFKLASSLNLELYGSYRHALFNEKKVSSVLVPALRPVPFYIAPLSTEKYYIYSIFLMKILLTPTFPFQTHESWISQSMRLVARSINNVRRRFGPKNRHYPIRVRLTRWTSCCKEERCRKSK